MRSRAAGGLCCATAPNPALSSPPASAAAPGALRRRFGGTAAASCSLRRSARSLTSPWRRRGSKRASSRMTSRPASTRGPSAGSPRSDRQHSAARPRAGGRPAAPGTSTPTRACWRWSLDELGLADAAPDQLTVRDCHRLVEMFRDRPATARGRIGALRRFLDDPRSARSSTDERRPRLAPRSRATATPRPRAGAERQRDQGRLGGGRDPEPALARHRPGARLAAAPAR